MKVMLVGWDDFYDSAVSLNFFDLVYVCLYIYKSQFPKWSEIIDDMFLIIYGY